MDSIEEDISARVLLRNVLHTEIPRTPVTRSTSRNKQASNQRRSSRGRNAPGLETPQLALRHKLRQKLHETATQSPVPPTKRQRSQGQKVKTPAVASPSLYDEDITPRGLLRGIIQTEAEASLLLSGQPGILEPEQQHVEPSIHSNRLSERGAGLELPDLATEPLSHLIRGMSRKRPPPNFNVSAFERQLDNQSGDGEKSDVAEESTDVTQEQDLSVGSKSALGLTLKTPFVNIKSEKARLQRKAAGRRQPSVGAFDKAVQKRLERNNNQEYTTVHEGRTLGDSEWQKFTLGLSNVTVPDLTTDIAMSNTELYAQSAVSVSHLKEYDEGIPEKERRENEKGYEPEGGRGDEGEKEIGEHQDEQNEHLNEKGQTESGQEREDSETPQEEQDDLGAMASLQAEESVGLSADEIPFAPTQAMTEPLSQTHKVRPESAIEEPSVEGMCLGESFSHLSERITRRAYHSEGRILMPEVTAKGRGTKSLGAGLEALEQEVQGYTGDCGSVELLSEAEESCPTQASPSGPKLKPSPSLPHETSLAEMEEQEGVDEGHTNQSEIENIVIYQEYLSPNPQSAVVEEEEEEEEEEQEEEEDSQASEELSMQTPSFIRKKKEVATPKSLPSTAVLKHSLNTGSAPKVKASQSKKVHQSASESVLPKSYVMSVFKHFARTKVASDIYPVINEILLKYFDRLADDLEAYSAHAKRKTIEVEDVELLMRRQGFVTDTTPVNVLIEKFLPLEYRKLLIPVATSGNKVIPSQRK